MGTATLQAGSGWTAGRATRLALVVFLSGSMLFGYTVLTHEAIIDSVWDSSLKKVLLKRFPGATAAELEVAHSYAYGGCIIQDMGYYPFSNRFFSDLTHYVRSGDFVAAMIRDSTDINEFAFALGALEHYAADTDGHRMATNHAVPILYPELKRKYGSNVTYWDNPVAHLRTEFGFDVLQVAMQRYAPDRYRAFIGFRVSRELLERAFVETYGIELKDVLGSVTLALGSYRYSIRSILPGMTRVAWRLKKDQLRKEIPGITKKKFLYNLSRSSYEKEWGNEYRRPGLGTRILAFCFRMLPSGGPFQGLRIRTPTPEVERLFMASFNTTVDRYKEILTTLDAKGVAALPNENLDAALATMQGKYHGSDNAYAKLVGKLAEKKFEGAMPDLRANILRFYRDAKAPVPAKSTARVRAEYARLTGQLAELKAMTK